MLGVETLRELDPAGLDADLDRLPDDVSRARVRHVVTEIERVRTCVDALRRNDFDEVGRLFVASHASLRDDYEVSCRELDLVVDTALGAGALGARMTGGGFGGLGHRAGAGRGPGRGRRPGRRRGVRRRGPDRRPQPFAVTAGPPAARDR